MAVRTTLASDGIQYALTPSNSTTVPSHTVAIPRLFRFYESDRDKLHPYDSRRDVNDRSVTFERGIVSGSTTRPATLSETLLLKSRFENPTHSHDFPRPRSFGRTRYLGVSDKEQARRVVRLEGSVPNISGRNDRHLRATASLPSSSLASIDRTVIIELHWSMAPVRRSRTSLRKLLARNRQ